MLADADATQPQGREIDALPVPPGSNNTARNGMSRRHPDQTSCAAPARAQIGPGQPAARRATDPSHANRSPPHHSLSDRGPLQIGRTWDRTSDVLRALSSQPSLAHRDVVFQRGAINCSRPSQIGPHVGRPAASSLRRRRRSSWSRRRARPRPARPARAAGRNVRQTTRSPARSTSSGIVRASPPKSSCRRRGTRCWSSERAIPSASIDRICGVQHVDDRLRKRSPSSRLVIVMSHHDCSPPMQVNAFGLRSSAGSRPTAAHARAADGTSPAAGSHE
jgi:hypothetical protein